MYIVTICSKKEAVIRKPHLFLKNVEQLRSIPKGPLKERLGRYGSAVGVLSGLRNALVSEGTIRAHY